VAVHGGLAQADSAGQFDYTANDCEIPQRFPVFFVGNLELWAGVQRAPARRRMLA
jgi:hypothetical protein